MDVISEQRNVESQNVHARMPPAETAMPLANHSTQHIHKLLTGGALDCFASGAAFFDFTFRHTQRSGMLVCSETRVWAGAGSVFFAFALEQVGHLVLATHTA